MANDRVDQRLVDQLPRSCKPELRGSSAPSYDVLSALGASEVAEILDSHARTAISHAMSQSQSQKLLSLSTLGMIELQKDANQASSANTKRELIAGFNELYEGLSVNRLSRATGRPTPVVPAIVMPGTLSILQSSQRGMFQARYSVPGSVAQALFPELRALGSPDIEVLIERTVATLYLPALVGDVPLAKRTYLRPLSPKLDGPLRDRMNWAHTRALAAQNALPSFWEVCR